MEKAYNNTIMIEIKMPVNYTQKGSVACIIKC